MEEDDNLDKGVCGMDVRHIGFARGSEKIYEKLEVTGVPKAAELALAARADNVGAIPAKLFELGRTDETRTVVAVVPDLFVPQMTLELCASRDGAPLGSATIVLKTSAAKWESRAKARLDKALSHEIRCYDEGRRHDDIAVDFVMAIPHLSEAIVHVAVNTPYAEDAKVSVRCLGQDGRELASKPIFMCSETSSSRITGKPRRSITTFSFCVDRGAEPVFVEATQETPDKTRTTFEVLLQERTNALVDDIGFKQLSAQHDPFYEEWLRRNRATDEELALQRGFEFDEMPLFSIIVPLFRTPAAFFRDMLSSVLAQSYARWELVLVNASPEIEELGRLVDEACASDARVRGVTLVENLGISENTNAGLDLATGDFVCFFDHDDLLEPDVLFEYARAINERPDTDLLYCDEDKFAPDGHHFDPFFKPDFSIDELRTSNYVCHLLCVRKSVLDALPRNTREYDGAQDHNLTLRVSEVARHIHHVPRMLYHWRVSPSSTAGNADDKPYANAAGIRAVSEHLKRLGIAAEVARAKWPFTYQVSYLPPTPHPLVSIIIPSHEQPEVLRACVESIFEKTTYDNYEVLLIENNSKNPATFACYDELVERFGERLRVERYEHPFNFSAICNYGVSLAKGDYLLLLNNDTKLITENWLERMVGTCTRPEVGVCGVRLLYPDDTIQHAGIVVSGAAANHLHKYLPSDNCGYFNFAGHQRNLSAVTAACVIVRRDAYELVGGFDEKLAVAYNDVDFCLRLGEKGLLVVYDPYVELVHYESISRGFDREGAASVRYRRELARFNERWAEILVNGDPYYNKNLNQEDPWDCWYHF